MAHTYLLDTYQILDQRLETAKASLTDCKKDDLRTCFIEGQIDALKDFKAYLSQNLDIKLPRRIYKKRHHDQQTSQNQAI